jgi:hypothetical protein
MNYKEVKKLSPAEFRRCCGVKPETFEQMVKVVAAEKMLQTKPGRPSKLSIEDQVLMTLTYWREYRTYFHLEAGGLTKPMPIESSKKWRIF